MADDLQEIAFMVISVTGILMIQKLEIKKRGMLEILLWRFLELQL